MGMGNSLLMGLGQAAENVGSTLTAGVQLRTLLEREKMQAVKEIEKVKLQGQLEREFMQEKAGLDNAREQSLLQQKLQNDMAIQADQHKKALDVEEAKKTKAIETEQVKQKLNMDSFNQMCQRIFGTDASHISPASKLEFMQKTDEAAGVPESLQGKGLGAMVLERKNSEQFKQGLAHLETQDNQIYGGTRTETTSKVGLSGEGNPYVEFNTTTKENPMPVTVEAFATTYYADLYNKGQISFPDAQAAIKRTSATPLTKLQEAALLGATKKDAKGNTYYQITDDLLQVLGIQSPGQARAIAQAIKEGEAIVAGTYVTLEAAVKGWDAYLNTEEPFMKAIVTARNSGTEPNKDYANRLESDLLKRRKQNADIFDSINGPKHGLYVDRKTFAVVRGTKPQTSTGEPFEGGHGTSESVKDLFKLMHPEKGN